MRLTSNEDVNLKQNGHQQQPQQQQLQNQQQQQQQQDVVRIICHCMEGRFKAGETSRTCAAVLRSLLDHCHVFLGQAAHFQPTAVELPGNFRFVGEQSCFLLYDSDVFEAVEHVWSPQSRIDGAAEVGHVVCRMKSKLEPSLEFFAISWFVRETYFNYNGARRCYLLFRQLVQLVQLLGRDLPVVVGGNYQLLPEEAEYLIGRERLFTFSEVDLVCLTYRPQTVRKQIRSCGFFLCGNRFLDVDREDAVGTRSIKGNVVLNGCRDEFWRNPEDSFYWDPMTLDLSAARIVQAVADCRARNGQATATPSPMSSASFEGSEATSLQSEPQEEGEEGGPEGRPSSSGTRSRGNFESVAYASKLRHLDLAEGANGHHVGRQMNLDAQREKLLELRNFLESLELKMDVERAAASFSAPSNYAPYEQGRAFSEVGARQEDDVAKSLSTICEHEELNSSSNDSMAEEFSSPSDGPASGEKVKDGRRRNHEGELPLLDEKFEETCQEYVKKIDAILTKKALSKNNTNNNYDDVISSGGPKDLPESSEGTVVDGDDLVVPINSCVVM